jgi:hypothetical protein
MFCVEALSWIEILEGQYTALKVYAFGFRDIAIQDH